MIIDNLILGAYQTNSYVLRADAASTDCLIVDTGLDSKPLIDFINEHNLNPVAVILTHGHADHIVAVPHLKSRFPQMQVVIHTADAHMLVDAMANLSLMAGLPTGFATEPADVLIETDQLVTYAGIKLQTLNVPGHTPGGMCLYSADDDVLFTGDCVFAGSIGRTDFPGYDEAAERNRLLKTIAEKLLVLPEATKVYPGHGPKTSLRNEKKNNPYLNGAIDF